MPTFRNTLSVPSSHLPLKMEQIECSEMSAYVNQTPGNHPKENKQHSEHGESLKSKKHSKVLRNCGKVPAEKRQRVVSDSNKLQRHLHEF